MNISTPVPRLARWKAALSLGAIAASLAFAGAANAAVIVVTPDGTAGTDNLRTAITTANTNSDTSNTLVLQKGRYTPAATFPAITKDLVITGDHALQVTAGATPAIQVAGSQQATNNPGNLFTINPGINVTMEAFGIINGGGNGFFQVDDAGNLTTWGMALTGAPGNAVATEVGANLALNESTVASMAQVGITNNGTMSLDTADVVGGSSTGIVNNGTYTLHNTLVIKNAVSNCVGPADTNGGPGSMDDSPAGSMFTCAVQFPNNTTVDSFFPIPHANGGPTATYLMGAGSPTENAGTNCQTTDERFFVNPGSGTSCDIGAVTRSAARNTSPPTCVVTGGSGGPPATQQVTVQDTGSGMGTQPSSANDPSPDHLPDNPRSLANPAMPDNAISGLGITNGTVAFTPFTAPSTGPLVLTATKTNQSMLTHWWFTATDWAGNVRFCQ